MVVIAVTVPQEDEVSPESLLVVPFEGDRLSLGHFARRHSELAEYLRERRFGSVLETSERFLRLVQSRQAFQVEMAVVEIAEHTLLVRDSTRFDEAVVHHVVNMNAMPSDPFRTSGAKMGDEVSSQARTPQGLQLVS